ncbi:MAG: 16S rRNA (adenine(1518)-N(6)/adenine(1519)-N(6))-dimethyltransferase RsmA [Actinomycetota bacterium]|nr:16S rRNA (adenine(1518)-N(6)/adenine(1519)-N(6))-dimethyltransferase RsmA [Actinomycetota bacterium]
MSSASPLLGAARVRTLLEKHDVRPNKSLGQNFVVDPNTIRKTLAVAEPFSDDVVLEVGPGVGSLTVGLAESVKRVVAIERDDRLIPVLNEVTHDLPNVEVVHADATRIDLGAFRATSLVANLPYNIAASIVLKVLEEASTVRTITVMTQREVGERLAAGPGTKTYGATSVLTAFFAQARVAATVSRNAFWPVPNVDSVIVRANRRNSIEDRDVKAFFSVVKAAFAQRRKTLRNALAPVVGSEAGAEALLRAAGVDPSARAESLAARDYLELARRL